MLSTTENIPDEEVKSTRIRRTKVMIAHENQQILDYIVRGATHDQIMKWVGLNEKNYWKRIATIRKRDMELTRAEQTPEAHAFLYKRTEEKFYHLESMTMQIAESKNEQARDKIEAMRFLRQLYEDQYSLFLYGPSQFITRGISSSGGSMADTLGSFGSRKTNHERVAKSNSNAVF